MKNLCNRELSWLQFNDRVLQEASDTTVPLMSRLRFLGIVSNNRTEFLRVRFAGVIRYAELKNKYVKRLSGGYEAAELLPMINERLGRSREMFISTFAEICSEMEKQGVRIVNETGLNGEQIEFCRDYFYSVVSIRLVPLLLRKSVPIPFLPDGEIYLAVKMSGAARSRYAILQLPVSAACPRFVVLPSEEGRKDVIFLDDIVRLCLRDIFFMFNYDSVAAYTFKVVRDAELTLDDDVSKSLSEKMYQGLSRREHGRAVRMIYDRAMPDDVLQTIACKLNIRGAGRLEPSERYHRMRDLMKFPSVRPDLEEPATQPLHHPQIDPQKSVIKVIRRQDVLLSYPYQTFNHFIDLLREAAVDPRVQSISITLYRTASHSKVINTLLNAVRNGKQVTAMVELKARFDEEHNIGTTDVLQNCGVRVINSLDGLKIHSKLALIERVEGSACRGYVYVGTGNFNEDTTMAYSDFGIMTSDEQVAEDARKVFDYLQNPHKHPTYKKLMVSPYFMRARMEEIIEGEIHSARKGKRAYIYGKFNSLTDERMIEKLYEASQAGVEIRLIVRGACCLRAGVEGVSERIEVRSIVDKYLEHARLLIACNGGKPQSWIMSADPMTRNLDRRVEVGIPIRSRQIHTVLEDYFSIQWADNTKARVIVPSLHNDYVPRAEGEKPHRSQDELYEYFKTRAK